MIINLSPTPSDEEAPVVVVTGQVITVNGEDFDFGIVPAGYTLPRGAVDSPWFENSEVIRDHDGNLTVTMRFPYPDGAGEDMRFPAPITVTEDGPLDLPTYTPPEVPNYEDIPRPGSENPDALGNRGPEYEPSVDPVPPIDGLDGDPAAGDPEADPGIGNEEAGGSPVESDRGIE